MVINCNAIAHVGVRVRDADAACAFYGQLGFVSVYEDEVDPVIVLRNAAGAEVNLIVNADTGTGPNVLMDVACKHPGLTHVALAVASMGDTLAGLEAAGIAITEGPVKLGTGTSVFIRDADGNVIELTTAAS